MMTALDHYQSARTPANARRTWLKTAERIVTYGELADFIDVLGGFLSARGLGRNDRVFFALGDDVDTALLIVGLICHGLTAVQIDPATPRARALALMARSRASLVITDSALAGAWSIPPGPDVAIAPADARMGGGLAGLLGRPQASGLRVLLEGCARVPPHDGLDPETLAYILFTSGTTSHSKGVCISHRALFAHLDTLSHIYGLTPESRVLNTLMLSHADGGVQGPLLAWRAQAALHRPCRFEVGTIEQLLDAVYQLRITHMIAVPTMLSLLVRLGQGQRDAFSGGDFRYLVSCGAALEAALWEQVEDLFGVELINLYGLTETVAGGVFAGAGIGSGARGAIGQPVDCSLRIIDEEGADVTGGATGELLMSGDLVMSGYFDDPELSEQSLRGGWLHTGDIARRDERGDYWICGRKKSVIIRGGLNIHPEEIVEVLAAHPQVREAVAFGEPDPEWGETVTALAAADAGVTIKDLAAWCRERLEPRKIPGRILLVSELPRGRSGKVVLSEARTLAAATPEQDPGDDRREGVDQQVIAAAAGVFCIDASDLSLASTPQKVVGWDSLAHLNLVFAVETEFGVKLTPREIMSIDSLGRIAELVRSR